MSILIVAVSLVILAPVNEGQRRAQTIERTDLALQQQTIDLRVSLSGWQQFVEPQVDKMQTPGAVADPTDIAAGSQFVQLSIDQSKALSASLKKRGFIEQAVELDAGLIAWVDTIATMGPLAAGAVVTPAAFDEIMGGERAAFAHIWDLTTSISHEILEKITASDARYVTGRFGAARTITVVVGSISLMLAMIAATVMAVRATRLDRTQRREAQRQLYGAELQQALELAGTEPAVYRVLTRALRDSGPQLDTELLIADSSNAHFRRVLGSNDDGDHASGCGVVSPRDCPATTRGHTMLFTSSDALSACPHLRDRPSGACSAVCIPVSIAGRAVGVMHSTGPDGILPEGGDLENLELSARRSAERVALLRTFEKSETQARTDPLTGLLNRRSLENQVRALRTDGGGGFALAYGDLDHFKVLNDTHGHEAGDQALRLFSRVLRDSVRPADLVSRYGGEEFVVVLPDCGSDAATAVLERVRERLALALTSGRVPVFTVSFGLAIALEGDTFDEIAAIADQALLAAKAAGRNRVILANPSGRHVHPAAPPNLSQASASRAGGEDPE